jgi:hypothetical protein
MEIASDVGLLRLAIAILKQSHYDCRGRYPRRRDDALAFLVSPWAEILADGVGLNPGRLREYIERHGNGRGAGK